jgi:hypothetical protein
MNVFNFTRIASLETINAKFINQERPFELILADPSEQSFSKRRCLDLTGRKTVGNYARNVPPL